MDLAYFQLIDRITDLNIGEKTIAVEAQVPRQHTIFEGHFPGYPLMPGVLLIESMAQTSGWLLIALMKFERMPFLASVREAKLRTFVRPGQRLTVEAKVTHDGSGFAMTEASISCDGRLVSNTTLTFRLVPFPSPEFAAEMRKRAEAVGLLTDEARADG